MEMQQSGTNSLKTLQLRIKELSSLQAKAGWLGGYNYPDGTSVAMIAAQNEFGNAAKNIPPRPTVRPAIVENQKSWEAIAAQGANRILAGKATARDVMEAIGESAESAIRKNYASISSPALKPQTLAARKRRGNNSSKVLHDTGLAFSTITSVVENATS